MAFFKKVFEGKPLKRIELKAGTPKFRIRASRTGGLNAAVHPLRGLTFNTKHGLRASKTFKGLTLGFQRSNSVVRGRWSTKDGVFNLNLSKSGFSMSGSSKWGSYNFKNPNRSSFKFAGIQLRGKKAKGLALLALIPQLIIAAINLIPALINLSIYLTYFLINIFLFLFKISIFLFKIFSNIFIWLSKFFILIGIIGYEGLMYSFVDLPKQIYQNRDIFYYLVSWLIKIFHWTMFIFGLLSFMVIFVTAIIQDWTLGVRIFYIFFGVFLFLISTLIGWVTRYLFLEDCNLFPFIKYKNESESQIDSLERQDI